MYNRSKAFSLQRNNELMNKNALMRNEDTKRIGHNDFHNAVFVFEYPSQSCGKRSLRSEI